MERYCRKDLQLRDSTARSVLFKSSHALVAEEADALARLATTNRGTGACSIACFSECPIARRFRVLRQTALVKNDRGLRLTLKSDPSGWDGDAERVSVLPGTSLAILTCDSAAQARALKRTLAAEKWQGCTVKLAPPPQDMVWTPRHSNPLVACLWLALSVVLTVLPNVGIVLMKGSDSSAGMKASVVIILTLVKSALSEFANPFFASRVVASTGSQSRQQTHRMRVSVPFLLAALSNIGVPVFIALCLSPDCFFYAWHKAKGLSVDIQQQQCIVPGLSPFANMSYCNAAGTAAKRFPPFTMLSDYPIDLPSPSFRYRTSCPSTVVQIYGPVLTMMTVFIHVGAPALKLYRATVTVQPARAGCYQRLRSWLARPPAHVVSTHAALAQSLASATVACTFGWAFPPIAVITPIALALNLYVDSMLISAACARGFRWLPQGSSKGVPVPLILGMLVMHAAFLLLFTGAGTLPPSSAAFAASVALILVVVVAGFMVTIERKRRVSATGMEMSDSMLGDHVRDIVAYYGAKVCEASGRAVPNLITAAYARECECAGAAPGGSSSTSSTTTSSTSSKKGTYATLHDSRSTD